jgi:hypothetical protein
VLIGECGKYANEPVGARLGRSAGAELAGLLR